MARIDRYVLARLLGVWGLSALVLVLVYWVERAVSLFDQLIADGQGARVFLELTVLTLPAVVELVLPIAAFVATLLATSRMNADSEVAAAQAAGVSPWRLARPVLLFGLVAAALGALLAHVLVPAAAGRLGDRQAEIAETATARLLRPGEFVGPTAGVTLYVREVTPEGELRDLLISDGRDADAGVTYTAARAYLVRGPAGPQIVMVEGLVQRLDRARGRLLVTTFADLAYDLGPLLGGEGDGGRSWRALSTGELLRPTPALAAETGRTEGELIAEGHQRLAEPFLSPAVALLAFGALMAGGFSRLGGWRWTLLAVVVVALVKGVEAVAVDAIEADPARWPLAYLPVGLGLLAAGGLLRRASAPRWRGAVA